MEPTKKAPAIESLLSSMFGRSRVDSIKGNICTWCGKPADKFRNEISRSEYRISGFCQDCQDKTFGED